MKIKIPVTKLERTMIVAALMSYAGAERFYGQGIVDLALRISAVDPTDDGPEVAILRAEGRY